jgi:hypothetical protein
VTPGPGSYPVAVLRAVRAGLVPVRQRGADVDGQNYMGGFLDVVTDTSLKPTPASPGQPPAGSAQPHKESPHLAHGRTIWLVLSVGVRPRVLVPSSTSTSCFMIALPVIIAVWVYLAYAIIVWRAHAPGPRAGGRTPSGPRPPRDPGGLDRHHHGHRARPVRLRHRRAGHDPAGAGGGEGPNPIWTPTSHKRPARAGHRPAVEVHLPLPDLRRVRDAAAGASR